MYICTKVRNFGNVPYVGQWRAESLKEASEWLVNMREGCLRRGFVVLEEDDPNCITMHHEEKGETIRFLFRAVDRMADTEYANSKFW